MHRRFLKSLATVMGAAALIVAPMAVSAQAAVIDPDETMDFSSASNDPGYWEEWLAETEDITAICRKDDSITKPYTIPAIEDFGFDEEEGYDDSKSYEYVLAVLKGGANQDEEKDAVQIYWYPKAGDQLSHKYYGNSHVILCITEVKKTTPPPSTTPPASTPPVVDTDRVETTGSGAGLGLYGAAAALLLGAGAIVIGRRRQGAHR